MVILGALLQFAGKNPNLLYPFIENKDNVI